MSAFIFIMPFDHHLVLVLILILAFPFQEEGLEGGLAEVSWHSRRRMGGGERSGGRTKGYSLGSTVVVV